MLNRAIFICLAILALSSKASAQGNCVDYFAAEWSNPLDMNEDADILNNIVPLERNDISGYSYSGGVATLTATGNDPWFNILTDKVSGSIADHTTRYGNLKPINATFYRYVTIRLSSDRVGDIQVFFRKTNGTWGITNTVRTSPGFQTYTIDMATVGISDGNTTWSGTDIANLRIDPIRNAPGATISVDFIQLTNTPCNFGDAPVFGFTQPDLEGGEDYFVTRRGSPANMDSGTDVDYVSGASSANVFPGKSYTDSNGITRVDDYLEAVSNTSDPSLNAVFADKFSPIDPSRYVIACWTLDLLLPVTAYHSVARVLWFVDGTPVNGDDILNKTTGESRYCVRLDTLAIEGSANQWRRNSDGTGIDNWRIDPHEDSEAITFRFGDVRIAADHEANQAFTVVMAGARDKAVTLAYRPIGGAATQFATVAANRNSDVVIWNTSAVPAGTYQIVGTVQTVPFASDGVIKVDHTTPEANDSTAPQLGFDAPKAGHRFDGALQIAGFAIDNRRVATVELFLNDAFLGRVEPNRFNIDVRNRFANLPYSSSAAFQTAFDTSGFAAGQYTFKAVAYDTAGNTTEYTAAVTKSAGNLTPDVTYPTPNEAAISVPTTPRVRPTPGGGGGGGTPNPKLSLTPTKGLLQFTVTGVESCSSVRIIGNTKGAKAAAILKGGTVLGTIAGGSATVTARAPYPAPASGRAAPAKKPAPMLSFAVDCGAGTKAAARRVAIRKFIGSARAKPAKVLQTIAGSFSAP